MDTMKKDKSKTYMIVGIIILVLALIGSTYAYYRYVFANVNVDTITRGLDYYITYAKGTDITNKVLEPSTDYTGGNSVSVTLYKKDNTYDIYGHIYLNVTTIGTALSNSSALKYVVTDGTNILFNGKLKGVTNGSKIPLAVNIPLNTTSTEYTVYLWFNKNVSEETSSEGQTISASVSCEASMKELKILNYSMEPTIFANKIYFSPNVIVTSNNIDYMYDTNNNLMKDIGGNIRYYGASPNNYIYFNCSDYSNQNDSTCEKWRIIGVFDGKIKIMRNSPIGTYAYDTSASTVNSGNGAKIWPDAVLTKLLNPGYDDNTGFDSSGNSVTVNNSLYWNAKSGTCYSYSSNATVTCNFTSIGLKNGETRNLIADAIYYLRGSNNSNLYVNYVYKKERINGTVYGGNSTTWTGKIALPYPSDYGYAADLSLCNRSLYYYNNSTCTSNNWMKSILGGSANAWLLTPNSNYSNVSWYVYSTGNVRYNYYISSGLGVVPTLYFSEEQVIKAGAGTSSSPYQLAV